MQFGPAGFRCISLTALLYATVGIVCVHGQEDESSYAKRVSKRGYAARVTTIERSAGRPPKAIFHAHEEGNYQIWGRGDSVGETEEKKVSLILDLVWPDANRPIPLAVGMEVTLGTDADNKIHVIQFALDELIAFRKRADGLVEVIGLSIDEAGAWPKPKGIRTYLAICPNTVDLSCYDWFPNVVWTDKEGLSIARWHGTMGDGSDDSESRRRAPVGWPIANQPNVRVIPGRDGWRLFQGLPESFLEENNLKKYLGPQFE